MIVWLLDIFWSLDSVAFRPCGTSSWCYLLICVFLAFDSDNFVASRFAHCITPSFYDVSESSHGASGALRLIVLSDGRESHLSVFSSCPCLVAQSLACLKLYIVFSLVDLLWFRLRPARTQLCAARPLELVLRAAIALFVVLLAHALRTSSCSVVVPLFIFGSLPDQFPTFLFLPDALLG